MPASTSQSLLALGFPSGNWQNEPLWSTLWRRQGLSKKEKMGWFVPTSSVRIVNIFCSESKSLKKRVQMYDIIPEVWAWGTIYLTFLHIFPCRTQGVPEKCVTLQRKHSLLRASLGARRPYPPRCKDPRRYFCRNNVRGSWPLCRYLKTNRLWRTFIKEGGDQDAII